MILDKLSEFSDQQAIVASAASTNVIDLGAPGVTAKGVQLVQSIGKASFIALLIQVTEDFDNLTSLSIQIETDTTDAFGSAKVIMSESVLLADLVEGRISPMDKLPRGLTERFLRLNYVVTGANPANGKISAGVVGAVEGGFSS